MTIISSHAEIPQQTLDLFMNASKGTEVYELRRLAQEVHANFGLQVLRIGSLQAFKPFVKFATPEGILCGGGSVVKDGSRDGQPQYRYFLGLPTIRKEKASANSEKDARDSNSLSVLIRSVKKNKEEPTRDKLLEAMHEGMKYTMRAVAMSARSAPRISYDHNTVMAMTRFILGVDSSIPNMYINELQEKFDSYQSQMKLHEAANADYARYARGVTLVCINTVEDKPHYLVCDAVFNTDTEKYEVQGDLKRYNSLADSPIADLAVMIRAHFQGTQYYDQSNELGVMRNDKFYPEIDISTGYSRPHEFWVAIPKHGQ